MRLSKDNTSWKAGGIIRRDIRNTKSGPEVEKLHGNKNTRKWCKGKIGVSHVNKWVKRSDLSECWNHRCQKCGKIFELWFKSEWFKRPRPKEIPIET